MRAVKTLSDKVNSKNKWINAWGAFCYPCYWVSNFLSVLTYSSGKVSNAVDVLHLCPDAQWLSRPVHRDIGIHSQLPLWAKRGRCTRRELSLGLEVWQLGSTREGERQRVISIPDMLPWQVPRACRMSCSSLTAAAASSPQLMSGSITSSIRPTPEDSNVSHLKGLKLSDKPLLCWLT